MTLVHKFTAGSNETYKMKIISLLIILFGIIKTKALECVSVVNQKCVLRPKILDVNEGAGEALFYPLLYYSFILF